MEDKELDALAADASVTHCYISKGMYYRPGSCGYTDFRHRAGVYKKSEALQHAKSCRDLTLVPIDVKEHNEMLRKEANDILSRRIVIIPKRVIPILPPDEEWCPECEGEGCMDPNPPIVDCQRCKGTGVVKK